MIHHYIRFNERLTPTLPEILSLGDAYLDKRWMGPEGLYLYSRYLDDLRLCGCTAYVTGYALKVHVPRCYGLSLRWVGPSFIPCLDAGEVRSLGGHFQGMAMIWIYDLPALQDRGNAIFSSPFVKHFFG